MTRTRLSLALLAATLTLSGCIGDHTEQNSPVDAVVGFDPIPLPGDTTIIPFPFDGLFAGAATPTLNIPNASSTTLITQANLQDGFSTTASWFIDIFGYVTLDSVGNNLVIVNLATGDILKYGTDFTVQSATVADDTGVPISQQRTRVLIEPLKPLAASTTYLVGLKRGVKTTAGAGVIPSRMFAILASSTAIASQTDPILTKFTATQKAQMEALRAQIINPTVQLLKTFGKVDPKDLVLAYRVTTQTTTKTLQNLAGSLTAQPIAVQATGKTPKDFNSNLSANADIYAGYLQVPYFLKGAAGDTHSTNPLTSFWLADASKPDTSAKFLGIIPCGAYATGATLPDGQTAKPSVSTTSCFPVPVKQSDQKIPLLVTVPKGVAKPAGGWPVVIFQHGITGNRSNMLGIAPALAQAGFVTVAIDLPLHGVDSGSQLYRNNFFAGTPAAALMADERTFDLDLVNNTTGAASPDGVTDSSGTHFINLASPITSRDNLRQGAADLLTLRKSLAVLDLDNDGTPDIDTSQVRFAGISLGGIVGGVFLGADSGSNRMVGASVLSVAGGGITRLLDASKSYGPRISGGLIAANGPREGTDAYESFMRLAQTLVDSGDPVNYAALASTAHPLLLGEVLGDTVVPNHALAGPTSTTMDFVAQSGYLSGTDPYGKALGLTLLPALDVPVVTPQKQTDASGLRVWLQFRQGSHGSLIDPTASLAVTTEMQQQAVNFLRSNGTCLPIGTISCP